MVFVLAHCGLHSNASLVYIYALLQVLYSHRDVRRPKFTLTNVLNLLLLTGCPMFILTVDG
jgi:surface polysaccharide O-acyltransferase-like enzyme